MAKEVTRYVKPKVERELWGRAAGRCQFCNRLLYKSPVTQEQVNISEKAHIYSFSKAGPRGWGPLVPSNGEINDLPNLMLVCQDCHDTIDQDKKGERYPRTAGQMEGRTRETRRDSHRGSSEQEVVCRPLRRKHRRANIQTTAGGGEGCSFPRLVSCGRACHPPFNELGRRRQRGSLLENRSPQP